MFTWDEAKRHSNLAKHGVDFSLAERLEWEFAAFFIDEREDYGEDRFNVLITCDGRLYNLVATFRTIGPRVIGLRKANKRERAKWEKIYAS